MRSLFLRMRLVHWIAIFLLVINVIFFTENNMSLMIQCLLIVAVIIHDIDEKRWGVDTLVQVSRYLETFARKNLSETCDINTSLNSEMRQVVNVMDKVRDNICGALIQIKVFSENNKENSDAIQSSCDQLLLQMIKNREITENAEQHISSTNDFSVKLSEVVHIGQQQMSDVNEQLSDALTDIDKLCFSMGDYATLNSELKQQLDVLSTNADSVKSVLDVVASIAEQTNLLALNAAIEAARAGEQGRGFAVVADEVRALAVRTQDSVKQINTIVQNITQASELAGDKMEKQSTSLSDVVLSTEKTAKTIKESENTISQATSSVESAVSYADDINESLNSIKAEVNEVVDVTEQNNVIIKEITDQVRESGQFVVQADEMLNQFKL